MRRFLLYVFAILTVLSLSFALIACDDAEIIDTDADQSAEMQDGDAQGDQAPHTHTYGEWQTVTPATCTTEGSKTRTCACGATETAAIEALGHSYDAVTTPPTCTEAGVTTHTCSRCGDVYTSDTVPALGHQYAASVIAATCTADGSTTYTCSRCSDHYAVVIPATDHTAGDPVQENILPATCTAEGSFDQVTYCVSCGAELSREAVTIPIAHSFGEWQTVTSATCTAEGSKTRTCSACNVSETVTIDALGHDLVHHNGVDATCTVDGYAPYDTCSRCDFSDYAVIAAAGHVAKDPVQENILPATCTAEGSYDQVTYCVSCGAELSREAVTTPTIAHTFANGACTVCGASQNITVQFSDINGSIKHYVYTDRVDVALRGGEVMYYKFTPAESGEVRIYTLYSSIDTFGILYNSNRSETLTTNDNEGDKKYNFLITYTVTAGTLYQVGICSNKSSETRTTTLCVEGCSAQFAIEEKLHSLTVDLLAGVAFDMPVSVRNGFHFLGWQSGDLLVTTPTYTANDSLTFYANWERHQAGDWVVTTPPTCTTNGERKQYCTGCDYVYATETLPATSHTAGAPVQENYSPANCTTDGSYDQVTYCIICGEEISRETIAIPSAGHVFVDDFCTVCGAALSYTATFDANGGNFVEHVDSDTLTVLLAEAKSYFFFFDVTQSGDLTITTDSQVYISNYLYAADKTTRLATASADDNTYIIHYAVTADTVYYVVCRHFSTPPTIKIKLEGCGAQFHVNLTHDTQSAEGTPSVTMPANVVRDGYHVTGWLCGETLITDSTFDLTADATFTAQWQAHSLSEWSTSIPATCSAAGEEARTCSCGYRETRAIDALPHTSAWKEEIAPTCYAKGKEIQYCSVCGAVLGGFRYTPITHTYGDWQTVTPAGCTTTGTKSRTCTICSNVETAEIPAGHNYQDGICTVCSAKKPISVIYQGNGYNYVNNGYADSVTVQLNGKNVLKYTFTAAWSGEVTIHTEKLPSAYSNVNTYGYLYNDTGTTVLAENDDISPTNFNFSITYTVSAGVTYQVGVRGGAGAASKVILRIEGCGALFATNGEASFARAAQTATEAFELSAAPTREGYHFLGWQIGGQSFAAGATYSATDDVVFTADWQEHIAGEWTVTQPATCTATGKKQKACTICAVVVETADIPLAEHIYGEWQTVTPAGCTTTGSKSRTCSVCSATDTAPIEALGHNYVAGICSRCSAEQPPIYVRVNNAQTPDANGDYILFGEYPQTKVTFYLTLDALNGLAGDLPTGNNSGKWTGYGYYHSGDQYNYMWYIDVTYGESKYRGVYFNAYRPDRTDDQPFYDYSRQDDSGYTKETVYWFKYEPIMWRILTEQDGNALLLSTLIIDAQDYSHSADSRVGDNDTTIYANNYAESYVRAWLNDTFYRTAFDALAQSIILETTVDNSARSTNPSLDQYVQNGGVNQYATDATTDRVFLASVQEMTSYCFSVQINDKDSDRLKITTDYAVSQNAGRHYWLRSPYYGAETDVWYVSSEGALAQCSEPQSTFFGIAPALWIRLS